jgi:DNA repair protein RadD
MKPREYQQESIDALYHWWVANPSIDRCPILALPTGSGKSIIIAELVRLLFDTWPVDHPRTIILVPSKELAEQNADKLRRMLPRHLSIGYYSASLGQKVPTADVIVATIGSIAKNAHVLGNIRCVIIDECHLVNPDGSGQYRQFLNDLAKYCQFRVLGLTATPFRGNGTWLTDGKDPLFCSIAHEVKIQRLLDLGFLSPLIRPIDNVNTHIETDDLKIVNGDFAISDLSDRVDTYIESAAVEACNLAKDRKKWIAFTPTVANADHLVSCLTELGIAVALVCGSTPKKEREELIDSFRRGELRCLVTVLALATGFDVEDIDCILWLRPTKSPVLYVQGSGRGMRISNGKTDCLWLDFTDTTARLGPVDAIKGRKKGRSSNSGAPFAICDNCGAQVRPASLLECPECGSMMREAEEKAAREASNAAIMKSQLEAKIVNYEVTNVTYREHSSKSGGPNSMQVSYWSGLKIIANEWICFNHEGFAKEKAYQWWARWVNTAIPETIGLAVGVALQHATKPTDAVIDESGTYPKIVKLI